MAGHVIAVADALRQRVARREALAIGIEQESGQRAWILIVPRHTLRTVRCQGRLDFFEERLLDDRGMLAGIRGTFVGDLAAIDPILQHGVERSPAEALAAIG